MTFRAHETIEKCDIVIGYKTYIDILKKHFPKKEFISFGMTDEKKRAGHAVELALEGKSVALCCSGDAGVYALTSLLYEVCEELSCFEQVDIVGVCGVTAAVSAGALVGAPLTNDYVSISLSDRITKYEVIEKRLTMAAEADMVTVLYNPKSKGRPLHLKKACDIFLEHRGPDTVCAIASRVGRDGESYRVLSLEELRELSSDVDDKSIDMQTTVFIGNSDTVKINGKMITKRGYHRKNEH